MATPTWERSDGYRAWLVMDERGVVHECWLCDHNADDAAIHVAEKIGRASYMGVDVNGDPIRNVKMFFRVRDDEGVETEHVVDLEWIPIYSAAQVRHDDRRRVPAWPEAKGG